MGENVTASTPHIILFYFIQRPMSCADSLCPPRRPHTVLAALFHLFLFFLFFETPCVLAGQKDEFTINRGTQPPPVFATH
jgi:hypothetical protein